MVVVPIPNPPGQLQIGMTGGESHADEPLHPHVFQKPRHASEWLASTRLAFEPAYVGRKEMQAAETVRSPRFVDSEQWGGCSNPRDLTWNSVTSGLPPTESAQAWAGLLHESRHRWLGDLEFPPDVFAGQQASLS
jgi:hypothetical protein